MAGRRRSAEGGTAGGEAADSPDIRLAKRSSTLAMMLDMTLSIIPVMVASIIVWHCAVTCAVMRSVNLDSRFWARS